MGTGHDWAVLVRAASQPHPPARASGSHDALTNVLPTALALSTDVAPDVVACSITQIVHHGYRTPVWSAPVALALDTAQYDAGDGPCLRSAREQRRVHLRDLGAARQFPAFRAAAAQCGVRSSLSLPLGGANGAALNLYADAAGSFETDRAHKVAALLARCVQALLSGSVVPGAHAVGDAEGVDRYGTDADVQGALANGQVVRQAQERVMGERRIDAAAAFGTLVDRARTEGRPMLDVARDLLRQPASDDSLR